MNAELIRTVFEAILGIGVIVVGISYAIGLLKKDKSHAAQDLNNTLNELLSARDVKIKDLEVLTEKQGQRITFLENQLHIIGTDKLNLEILIKTALKEHFTANPEMANDLSKTIALPSLKNV